MITVITELGDHIILAPALIAQGDAAVEAYVIEQRTKVLKLPATPLHHKTDAAKIAELVKKRGATPPSVIEPPVEKPVESAPAKPVVAEEA